MNKTELTDEKKLEFKDSLLGFFLLIAFLTSETGNVCFMYTLFKKKFSTITGNWLKALTISNAWLGVACLLPPCISMVNDSWLENMLVCRMQGFLANVCLMTTSLLLLCQSSERYFLQEDRHTKKRQAIFRVLIPGTFIFSGLVVGLTSFKAEPFTYVGELYSCDMINDVFTMAMGTFTVAVPCFCTIMFSVLSVHRPKRCRVHPISASDQDVNRIELGFSRHTATYTSPTEAKDKESSKVFAVLLSPLAAAILTTFLSRHVSYVDFDGSHELVRLSLFFTGIAVLVQPCILLLFSNSLKTSIFELLFRQKMASVHVTQPFRLIQDTPRPRSDLISTSEIPAFLQQNKEMDIHVQVSSNMPSSGEENEISRKESILSTISCEIQFATFQNAAPKESCETEREIPRYTERERLVSFSSTTSNDSLFIRIGTSIDARIPWVASSPSIVLSDSLPKIRSRISIDTISSNYSKSRTGSSDSEQEMQRRQTAPPLSYNMSLVHKILPQAWVSENIPQESPVKRRHSLHTKSTKLGDRMQVVGTLTPVESVGSMEVSPRISTDSSCLIARHPLRMSRLHSCLHKLEEASSRDSLI